VAMAISIFFLFIKYRFEPVKKGWKKFRPIFIFIFILFTSILFDWQKFNLFQNIVGLLYLFRLILYFMYFFYIKNYLSTIKNGLLLIAILTIISTLIQYFLYPDLRNLIYQGWDPHLYRTFGVFFDTSISAAIFGVFFLTINLPIIKIIYLLLVALSFSRSIYLGLSLTLIYLFIQQKRFKHIFLFLLIFTSLISIIPKPSGEGVNLSRLYSIESRIVDYREGIELWKNKPIFGYGYNRIRYIKNSNSVHSGAAFSSIFITILVSSGILGLLSFIWALWSLRKINRIAPRLLLFLCIISLFDNILLHPFILFLFFISLTNP